MRLASSPRFLYCSINALYPSLAGLDYCDLCLPSVLSFLELAALRLNDCSVPIEFFHKNAL